MRSVFAILISPLTCVRCLLKNKHPTLVEKVAWPLVPDRLDSVSHELVGHHSLFLVVKDQTLWHLSFAR
jgi:hypothetical protein